MLEGILNTEELGEIQVAHRSIVHKIAGISPQIRRSRELARGSRPYSRLQPDAPLKVLFVGDSTVVGVGGKPEESIAGRFAQQYPQAHIENYAVTGARAKDVLEQLEKAQGRYDLTLINVGGNDVIALTPLTKLREYITQVLEKAKEKSDKVAIGLGGQMELIPMAPKAIRGLLRFQQQRYSELYQELTNKKGALYINYFEDRELNGHFARDPQKFFSEDRFHPSGAGYEAAYKTLTGCLEKEHYL